MNVLYLGSDVYLTYVNCAHGKGTGGIVSFGNPATEGACEGMVSWCAACPGETWELRSEEPLTIEPSVACKTHPEHHGWIRDGRWTPA